MDGKHKSEEVLSWVTSILVRCIGDPAETGYTGRAYYITLPEGTVGKSACTIAFNEEDGRRIEALMKTRVKDGKSQIVVELENDGWIRIGVKR
jgi:hypothetical protein